EYLVDLALVEIGRDAGDALQHLADVAVDDMAERIRGNHALDVRRVPLRGDRGRAALALAADGVGVEQVQVGRESNHRDHVAAGAYRDRPLDGIESGVGDLEGVLARGDTAELKLPVARRERLVRGAGKRHMGAFEEGTRGGVDD